MAHLSKIVNFSRNILNPYVLHMHAVSQFCAYCIFFTCILAGNGLEILELVYFCHVHWYTVKNVVLLAIHVNTHRLVFQDVSLSIFLSLDIAYIIVSFSLRGLFLLVIWPFSGCGFGSVFLPHALVTVFAVPAHLHRITGPQPHHKPPTIAVNLWNNVQCLPWFLVRVVWPVLNLECILIVSSTYLNTSEMFLITRTRKGQFELIRFFFLDWLLQKHEFPYYIEQCSSLGKYFLSVSNSHVSENIPWMKGSRNACQQQNSEKNEAWYQCSEAGGVHGEKQQTTMLCFSSNLARNSNLYKCFHCPFSKAMLRFISTRKRDRQYLTYPFMILRSLFLKSNCILKILLSGKYTWFCWKCHYQENSNFKYSCTGK